MENWIIPSLKTQSLVLDRLAEFYFSWVDNFIELMSEMTWEISFKELRAAVLYLIEFWYIKRSYTWKWNEFFVKITKKWIKYYEKIFTFEEKIYIKPSFLDRIKKLSEWVNALKWIATWAVAIFTIFWISFHSEIVKEFSVNIFSTEKNELIFTKKEAIKFLRNKFNNEWKIACTVKSKNEIICKITNWTNWFKRVNLNHDLNKKNILYWSSNYKKTTLLKRIVLRKNNNWIILIK